MALYIKFCGFTSEQDVEAAIALGVNAVGFVLDPRSKRYVSPQRARELAKICPKTMETVAVFDQFQSFEGATEFSFIQCVAPHPGYPWIAACHPPLEEAPANAARVLLDSRTLEQAGGTGIRLDQALLEKALTLLTGHEVILAGGLTAGNVAEAIGDRKVFGVDVSSGIEDAPGIKSSQKMTEFVQELKKMRER